MKNDVSHVKVDARQRKQNLSTLLGGGKEKGVTMVHKIVTKIETFYEKKVAMVEKYYFDDK